MSNIINPSFLNTECFSELCLVTNLTSVAYNHPSFSISILDTGASLWYHFGIIPAIVLCPVPCSCYFLPPYVHGVTCVLCLPGQSLVTSLSPDWNHLAGTGSSVLICGEAAICSLLFQPHLRPKATAMKSVRLNLIALSVISGPR